MASTMTKLNPTGPIYALQLSLGSGQFHVYAR